MKKCTKDGREWYRATLREGARAGDFSILRRTTSMKTCKELCCASDSCELALLVNGGCFSVQCKSADACMPQSVVKRSGIVAPRIFVRNIGKLSLLLSQISNISQKLAIESAVFIPPGSWKLRESIMVLIESTEFLQRNNESLDPINLKLLKVWYSNGKFLASWHL